MLPVRLRPELKWTTLPLSNISFLVGLLDGPNNTKRSYVDSSKTMAELLQVLNISQSALGLTALSSGFVAGTGVIYYSQGNGMETLGLRSIKIPFHLLYIL